MELSFVYSGNETVGAMVVSRLEAAGCTRTDDVAHAEAIITYCTSQTALEDAYFDEQGLVQAAGKGALLIDLSASTPSFARYFVDAEFMVDDLEALRRGGRIPSSVAYAGSKLDVKPLLTITVDGKLSLAGVARGRKKGIKQLAEYYNKRKADSRPGRCVVIGNADCPKDAARLQEALGKGDDSILFLESSIGPVIGSHVGPDMIAVVFWGNDKREELSVADRIAKKVKGGE